MRKPILLGMACGLAISFESTAALIVHEPFDYPVGNLTNQNGGTGWPAAWTNSGNGTVVSPGLIYDDIWNRLISSSNACGMNTVANSRDLPGTYGAAGQTIYVSFIGRVDSAFAAGLSLHNGNAFGCRIGRVTQPTWQVSDLSGVVIDSGLPSTQTSLLVVRLDFAASTVTMRLYVNPPLAAEPGTPTGSVTRPTFTFNRIQVLGSGANVRLIDEIRLGTTWADVTPHTPAPLQCYADNVSLPEGNSGTTDFVFNVGLNQAANQPVTVDFLTSNGTALAGSDYVATNGSVTFNSGETNKTVTARVNGDATVEYDETFRLVLTNAVNAGISTQFGAGTGTILDDDFVIPALFAEEQFRYPAGSAMPGLNGGTGWSNEWIGTFGGAAVISPGLTHTDGSSSLAVSSNAASLNGNFVSQLRQVRDLDRVKDGTLYVSFLGRVDSGSVALTLNKNGVPTFSLGRNNASANWNVSHPLGDWSVVSGVPTTTQSLIVMRVDYSGVNMTVRLYVNPALSAEPAVPVGQTNLPARRFDTIALSTSGLSSGAAAFDEIRVASTWAAAVPLDALPPPGIAVSDAVVYEGNSGTNLLFNVSLGHAFSSDVMVNIATSDGTAVAGSDFVATTGVLTFAPGETNKTIVVPVMGDAVPETNETFTVILSNAVNGVIQDGIGIGTILDDDTPPRLVIGPGRVMEGDSGVTQAVFRVRLSQIYGGTVSVNYASSDGTATAGVDYAATSGTVTFAPGELRKNISVSVSGDTEVELNETFFVRLSNPINCTLANTNGPGLIGDNDNRLTGVTNVVLLENGDSVPGESNLVFKEFLDAPVINLYSEMAFVASTMDTSGGNVETNLWLWTGPTNELTKIAGTMMQAVDYPAGATYSGQFAFPNLDDEGNVTFLAGVNVPAAGALAKNSLSGEVNRAVFLRALFLRLHNSTVSRTLAKVGEPVPDCPDCNGTPVVRIAGDAGDPCGQAQFFDASAIRFLVSPGNPNLEFLALTFDGDHGVTTPIIGPDDPAPTVPGATLGESKFVTIDSDGDLIFVQRLAHPLISERIVKLPAKDTGPGIWTDILRTGDTFSTGPPPVVFAGVNWFPGVAAGDGNNLFVIGQNSFVPPLNFVGAVNTTTGEKRIVYMPTHPNVLDAQIHAAGDNVSLLEFDPGGAKAVFAIFDQANASWVVRNPYQVGDSLEEVGTIIEIKSVNLRGSPTIYGVAGTIHVVLDGEREALIRYTENLYGGGSKSVELLTSSQTKIHTVAHSRRGNGGQRGFNHNVTAVVLDNTTSGAYSLNWLPHATIIPAIDPLRLTATAANGLINVTMHAGTPGFYALECSSDLSTWREDAKFFGAGPFEFITSTENEPVMFFRARTTSLTSKDNQLFLQGMLPSEFGANGFLQVDLNSDGLADTSAQASGGEFKLWADTTSVPNNGQVGVRFVSANGTVVGSWGFPDVVKRPGPNPATGIPIPYPNVAYGTCVSCPECAEKSSANVFNSTATPVKDGVHLASGNLEFPINVFTFGAIGGSAGFSLIHSTGFDYAGAFGQNWSFGGDLRIQRTGANTAVLWPGNNQPKPMVSSDGVTFTFPNVSGATATYSTAQREFTVTLVDGTKYCIAEGLLNEAGHLVSITDASGNKTAFSHDESGNLTEILTPNEQPVRFKYSADAHLDSVTDLASRKWEFVRDASQRLVEIISPATDFADIAAGELVTDTALVTVTKQRRTHLAYADPNFPNYLTSITDERGAVTREWTYDPQGRVSTQTINGKMTRFTYGPTTNPTPLAKLEPDNIPTRVIDPEGNVVDTEMVGANHAGQYGIRRRVTWTESGKGNAPLRAGEPMYYEQRWQQDCDCLTPVAVTQPFSSQDAASLVFDANKIPQNWPRTVYTYNAHRQPLVELHTDGTESIRSEMTYQPGAFGVNNQFSKLVTRTEARAFDSNPIYSGLNFVHTYEYDARGRMIKHTHPTVTRGVVSPQPVEETWTYNARGQMLTHTDANGNITLNSYHAGPSFGGNINSKGNFLGHLATTTRGANGSANSAANLTTLYFVNALGQVTRRIDPMGRTYDTEYNNVGEVVREVEPEVVLRNGQRVRYETRYIHDGAGNRIMARRRNIDFDGSVSANEFIDRSMSFDAGNLLLAERVEVDGKDANDLIARYAHDGNDQLAVIQKPEGNRVFRIYDERRMLFKEFTGVASGTSIADGYPADKRAANLGGTAFVALTRTDYDSRGNPTTFYDGRGNTIVRGFDFRNRQVFETDQNRNGWVRQFDDAGNVLAMERGAMPAGDGVLTSVLARSYARFDELGRQYQSVQDINLLTSELNAVDPAGADNSSFRTQFDAGSRTVASFDANGNATTYLYDAADRRLTMTDALNNSVSHIYNASSRVIGVLETEIPGPGASGADETYTTMFVYDELNRRVATHVRGLNGNSIDHVTRAAYDSRGNVRLVEDAEGVVSISEYDDANRLLRSQRFDHDPTLGGAVELQRSEFAYDSNSRKILDRAYSQVGNSASAQDTRYAYDAADRLIRTVYPDSDDPINGSGNGVDGIYDRIETVYDANSNPITVTEQRGVVFNNTFDPGNRLTDQMIALAAGAPGTDRQQFVYDALNRVTSARNNFAAVDRVYDSLSRMTTETQSIRLDGSGFVNGWEQPVNVLCSFDRQSNRSGCAVIEGANTDLLVTRTFDELNRVDTISAAYFNVPNHLIGNYNYFGPGRIQTKTLGNGAVQMNTFDVKRRLATLEWRDPGNNLLAGFEYSPANGSGYDKVDNVLHERWLHDDGRYDHYRYSKRYELTGVEYRTASVNQPTAFGDTFNYDDNYNRTSASFGDSFNTQPNTSDTYTANVANEYTQITRDSMARNPTHDRAGNMTTLPVRPVTANPNQPDVNATARWDAFNLLFDIDTGVAPQHHYRYDPFRRRIVALDNASNLQGSRRFIYDGWDDVEERVFSAGATLVNAPSTLERVYVQGLRVDEPLLAAIDRNGDRLLGAPNAKNVRSAAADQEYYFLANRLGSVVALLDADIAHRVLDYYRHASYGETTVLPTIDDNMDGFEDTPLDLSDNHAFSARHSQEFGNPYGFTGRRFDDRTGLFYLRNRHFDSRSGSFLSRDPLEYHDAINLYQYGLNNPVANRDPFGLGCESASEAWASVRDRIRMSIGGNPAGNDDEAARYKFKTSLALESGAAMSGKFVLDMAVNIASAPLSFSAGLAVDAAKIAIEESVEELAPDDAAGFTRPFSIWHPFTTPDPSYFAAVYRTKNNYPRECCYLATVSFDMRKRKVRPVITIDWCYCEDPKRHYYKGPNCKVEFP